MENRLFKITIIHILIILFWSFLYKAGLLTENEGVLNLSSITLIFTIYFLYNAEISRRESFKFSNLFVFLSLILIAISVFKSIKFNFIFIIISIILTSIYTRKFIDIKIVNNFNILPISKKMTKFFVIALVLFSFLLIYFLDLDSFIMNIFYQIIFLVFELCFNLFLIEKENNYEKNLKLYYLSDYMAEERNEFARIVHDDIIQDIYAAKNYLTLKNPDINYSKEILNNLEEKSRSIMKFYQNYLFENLDLKENIVSIFENVKNLYPDKNFKIEKIISDDIKNIEKAELKKIVNTITKELINNIYKHSNGNYLIYKISIEDDIKIYTESNGNDKEDLEKIKNSKRGVLLIELLLENKGNIKYKLDNDILTTEVRIEVNHENNFYR